MQNKWKLTVIGEINGMESTSIYHTVLPAQAISVCSHVFREVPNQRRSQSHSNNQWPFLIQVFAHWVSDKMKRSHFLLGANQRKISICPQHQPVNKKSLAIMQVESLPTCCCQPFNGISTACCVFRAPSFSCLAQSLDCTGIYIWSSERWYDNWKKRII